ncbi:glycoside hydrolase family 2 protein [Paraburkholderia phosphatilytica]|uniref:glycoside hydrolase family 2 protein n=1 Tax=Paraburkholderia phosphatilytica TaxID=2282883 RepID=UPI0013DFC547|nr:glycoside hydrolase family 2 protein [Paraburkholderia phosphatilytica]
MQAVLQALGGPGGAESASGAPAPRASADDGAIASANRTATVWPRPLTVGWQCVSTAPGACANPAGWPRDGWIAAEVPGTVASAWRAAGKLDIEHAPPFAFQDHWYRTAVTLEGPTRVRLHGLATLCEVWIDDARVLTSDSMFESHDLDLDVHGSVTLALCFRSLTPLLEARRSRARWRPRLVSPPTLRNVRTTLLGHMPGWCPAVQAVGPWRPVELLGDAPHAFDTVDLATHIEGDDGIVALTLTFVRPQHDGSAQDAKDAALICSGHEARLTWTDARTLTGTLRVPNAERWWPHTHGAPALHDVTLRLGTAAFALGEVGFRTLEIDRGADGNGFAIRVNGTPVFCRGACWTSADLVTLTGSRAQLEHAFQLASEAGMNMLRVGGTMVYESDSFYALAAKHGVLVWQDFAFANFDYPNDDAFAASVAREATQFLARTRRFPSLAVLCGGSEIDQQAAMFGLPPEMRRQALFSERLPAIVAEQRPDVPYVEHSPTGGAWPFSTRTGVTHYYGVGAYQRPLDDARRAGVRFAAECLAFANIPDDATLHEGLGTVHAHDPRWKTAVPRDQGAGWDFDDVRDHYLRTLYGVEPARLRYEDPARYLALSRAVVAEVMSDVFAEWRRASSSCMGGLVWQFQDLRAGAGWGLVDALGRPKSAWHALSQTFQPVQLAFTDEGLDGLDLHLINETATPRDAELELVCLRDGAVKVASAKREVELPARSTQRLSAADVLGQFFDFTFAYRFGPLAHEVTIATLRDKTTGGLIGEAFHLPDRRAEQRHDLGLSARVEQHANGWQLVIEAKRFARYVHIEDAHYRAALNWFHLAPNQPRIVPLVRRDDVRAGSHTAASIGPFHEAVLANDTSRAPDGEVRAINSIGPCFYR